MAKFCPLFSSSSGNSTYVGTAEGGILIDVGVSAKRTKEALWDIGVDTSRVHAIFITHEHSDHVKGLRVFASRHHIPVYASAGTLAALDEAGILDGSYSAEVIGQAGVAVCDMLVRPFATSHDARESFGYTVNMPDNKRIALATDMGMVNQTTREALYGCDLVMLESNHDVNMLQNGSYPYFLKRRILSDRGHLSNESCAQTLVQLLQGGTTRILLGHLSQHNNIPHLAYETSKAALLAAGAVEGSDYLLEVAGAGGGAVGF